MWQVYGYMEPPPGYSRSIKGEMHGPLPRKRWIKKPGEKYKLAYRSPKTVRRPALGGDDYNKRSAVAYAEWLAKRDGVAIDPQYVGRAIMAGFHSRYRKGRRKWAPDEMLWCSRVCAVQFGPVRIEIPNWDFEHPPLADIEQAQRDANISEIFAGIIAFDNEQERVAA